VGIDLSGSEKKKSGICILRGDEAHLDTATTDEEIIAKTLEAEPSVISIEFAAWSSKGQMLH